MGTLSEHLEKLWGTFPEYLASLFDVLTNPYPFVQNAIAQQNTDPVQALRQAVLFLVYSSAAVGLAGSIVAGIALDDTGDKLIHYAAVGFIVVIVFVALEAAALRLSWQLVGGRAPYKQVFLADCYFFGTSLLLCGISILIFLGATRAIGLENKLAMISLIAFVTLGLCTWMWFYWDAYRRLNKLSMARSIAALALATVLTTVILIVDTLLLVGIVQR